MKRILILVLAFALTIGVYSFADAQNPLNDCFNYLEAQDYQDAIISCQQAVSLYPNSFAANIFLGRAYYHTGQLDLALDSFKKAAMYAPSTQYLAAAYNWLGVTYDDKGNLDNALFYDEKSLKLEIELGNKNYESMDLNNIAGIFKEKSEFNKALSYFKKSLILISEKGKAAIYNNIATIYYYKGEYAKAVSYYKKALAIDTRYGDYNGSGTDMLNLGNAYRKMKDFNDAYYYLQEGVKRVKKVGDKYWEAYGYKYLGWYFRDKSNKKLAENYLTKAYTMFKSIGAEKEARYALDSLKKLQ